ncbi:MAG: hypothetical protein ACI4W2_08650 [Eubacterium sp.]
MEKKTKNNLTAEEAETLRKYGDIIDLPHPRSNRHPHMSAEARAAQFAPFAALTGFETAIRRTGRKVREQNDDAPGRHKEKYSPDEDPFDD